MTTDLIKRPVRYTWKKDPKAKWSRHYTIGLNRNGERVATLQGAGDAWFWYGAGHNTASRLSTLDDAKADCLRVFKEADEAALKAKDQS